MTARFLLYAAHSFTLLWALTHPWQDALALTHAQAARVDSRIRHVIFKPNEVIEVATVPGIATQIVLHASEQYRYHVLGDSAAYDFSAHNNLLFFKPAAPQANTNLLVVTDQHSYAFHLRDVDPTKARGIYKLVFVYPDNETPSAQTIEQQQVRQALAQAQPTINWYGYTQSGDLSLAPRQAWDDGRQTWLVFDPHTDIPAVYQVTDQGEEVISDFHMRNANTMVLHRTAPRWHLRQGSQVLAIHNENYRNNPAPVYTGTVSPEVVRFHKGTEPQTPWFEAPAIIQPQYQP